MNHRALYDAILDIRREIEQELISPALDTPDYKLIVALGATYSLQEYLANRIAETSVELEDQ